MLELLIKLATIFCLSTLAACARYYDPFIAIHFNDLNKHVYLPNEANLANVIVDRKSQELDNSRVRRNLYVNGSGSIYYKSNVIIYTPSSLKINGVSLPTFKDAAQTDYVLQQDGVLVNGFLRDFD